jgi:polyferredoxin
MKTGEKMTSQPLPETEKSHQSLLKRLESVLMKTGSGDIRSRVQLAIFILTVAIGLQFSIYVYQALHNDAITVERPPGVEGFLPIGALMGWKLFAATGAWDPVHPAAMVILGFAGLISLLLRKSFCGWFCPVGTLSEWLGKLGRKIFGKNFKLSPWFDYPLRSLKYLLLSFFVWIIFSMNSTDIHAFLQGPYYKVSDVKMLFFFTKMSALAATVLLFLTLTSLPIKNFWCRYLCPYGALMGILAFAGPTRIQRNPESCIGCSRCSRICPADLPIDRKLRVLSPECSGCMDCTEVCPVEDTLQLKTAGFGRKAWSALTLGTVIIVLFAGLVYTARISGHWQTGVPEAEFRLILQKIDSPELTHP